MKEDINPYYAAYLEHFPEPEDQKDNWQFIVWILGMHSEFRRENKGVGGCPYDEQTEKKFLEFIRVKNGNNKLAT